MRDHKPVEREFHYERLKKIIANNELSEPAIEPDDHVSRVIPKRNGLILWTEIILMLSLGVLTYLIYAKFSNFIIALPFLLSALLFFFLHERVNSQISYFLGDPWVSDLDFMAIFKNYSINSHHQFFALNFTFISWMVYLYFYADSLSILHLGLASCIIFIPMLVILKFIR